MDLGLQYEQLKCYSCVLDTVVRREETQESIVSDSMPDIGTVAAVDGRHVLHRIEISPPVFRHIGGIVQIRLIKFLDVRRVAREEIRIVAVLLHHIDTLLCERVSKQAIRACAISRRFGLPFEQAEPRHSRRPGCQARNGPVTY